MKPPVVPPWVENPYRLWSLWDMKEVMPAVFASNLETMMRWVAYSAGQTNQSEIIDEDSRKKLLAFVGEQADEEKSGLLLAGLESAFDQAVRFCQTVRNETCTWAEVLCVTSELKSRFTDGLKRTKWLQLESENARYYNSTTDAIFGDKECSRFKSIVSELKLARRCYAFELHTACVYHLMRAMEGVCKAVMLSMTSIGVVLPGPVGDMNGWGDYQAVLKNYLHLYKKPAATSAEKERHSFYQEIYNDLQAMYKAARCPTMHLDKSYDADDAQDTISRVKTVLRHVSRHLDEKGNWNV